MRIDYFKRFDRSFEKLPSTIQHEVIGSIDIFLKNLVTGVRPQGIGLRRLKENIWEIRVGLKYRILFEMKKDWITFLFIGTHDEVRKFLKHAS